MTSTEKIWPKPNTTSEFIQAYDFEIFNIPNACESLIRNRSLMLTIVAAYLLSVFLSQKLMKNTKPLELRSSLFIWNILLAVFSVVGFLRTYPEPIHLLLNEPSGIYKTICTYEVHNYATGFWALISTISKIVELGDTAFIILRKQKLIFLHWYHHTSVILLTWFGYEAYDPIFRVFVPMNYFIHAWMYAYYALKSQKVPIPGFVSVAITSTQITQMIIGSGLSVYSLHILMNTNHTCHRPLGNVLLGLFIFGSYFILFLNFFFHSYFRRSSKKATKTN
jgi:elongation of very long chain fatty acids protein 6